MGRVIGSLSPTTAAANRGSNRGNSTPHTLDKMPPEIVLHILSYLHVFDFFPLKLANRYMYRIVNSSPRLTFTKYVAELEAEDRRRGGTSLGCRSAMAIAASRGQEALVMQLQLNAAPDEMGRTALHWAAENGQSALVRVVVGKGSRTWLRDKRGDTALDLAARNGHRKATELLTEKRFFRTWSVVDREVLSSALYAAASNGQKDIIQILLDRGADVDAKTSGCHGNALHVAAHKGFDEIVRLLLDHGARLEEKGLCKQTPLWCATAAGQVTTAQLLLDRGADLEATCTDDDGNSALHRAALTGNTNMMRMLLDRGAEVEARNLQGCTPLLCATLLPALASDLQKRRAEATCLLLDSRANIDVKDRAGRTALHNAVKESGFRRDEKLISLLLDRGADVNAVDKKKRNPLHYAAESWSTDIYQLLKDRGADENTRDVFGYSPEERLTRSRTWSTRPPQSM